MMTAMRRTLFLLRAGVLLVGLGMVSAQANAPGGARLALVIGNGAYPAPADLPNPVRDAEAMAGALERSGFGVTLLRDANAEAMRSALADFGRRLQGRQAIALLYYAGHGVQIDWRNYMLPVDARFDSPATVRAAGLDLAEVLKTLKDAGTRTNIVVLDACRDNPFAGQTGGRGLAPMDAHPGTFLAYATAPGHVALDGREGGNSLYTGALVRELARPQARIEDIFKRVRLQVRQRSGGKQVPWESTSLEDDFVFETGQPVAAPTERERTQAFAAEKPDWQRVRDSNRPEELYAFLDKHPSGLTTAAVLERLDLLEAPKVLPQMVPPPVLAAPAAASAAATTPAAAPVANLLYDYRVGDRFEWQYRDGLTGLPMRRETWAVTAIKGERVELNGGEIVLTRGGSTIRNDTGIEYDPPLPGPRLSELRPGHRWEARSEQSRARDRLSGWVDVSYVARAFEEVTVAAGTFKAWRVQAHASTQTGLRADVTAWVTPGLGTVRWERRARHRDGRDDSWTRELVAYQLAPR